MAELDDEIAAVEELIRSYWLLFINERLPPLSAAKKSTAFFVAGNALCSIVMGYPPQSST
jgi:hypothetical protein